MADEISIPNELKELFAKYEELKAGILNRYTQLVTAVLNGEITDENEMEEIMDGLLDYGDDGPLCAAFRPAVDPYNSIRGSRLSGRYRRGSF